MGSSSLSSSPMSQGVHPFESALWLVGLMACGKSSVMKVLTEQHGFQGIDTDTLIIERAGQPIAEIFSNEGETGFRQREQTVVKKLAAQKPQHTVIATGGGAPCFFDNMKVMNASGITIFLDGTPELLADRTMVDEKAGKPVRPLIAGMDRESRIAKFEEFSTKRRPFYEQAHITISLLGKDIEEIVGEILNFGKFNK